ncbi:hypothetical protein K431DRAFT_293359 [Polychaeton citri CBS 116435]|uniref:Uncharacterized protein n=1 Tax=Polychaeton citri CBS 116435 TaxID=1314669 RepID=A0A9P4QA83_9PEZI|nr:hypothetical protein K431DRAFT_293359 [Polychaeton citri CBS 116435]
MAGNIYGWLGRSPYHGAFCRSSWTTAADPNSPVSVPLVRRGVGYSQLIGERVVSRRSIVGVFGFTMDLAFCCRRRVGCALGCPDWQRVAYPWPCKCTSGDGALAGRVRREQRDWGGFERARAGCLVNVASKAVVYTTTAEVGIQISQRCTSATTIRSVHAGENPGLDIARKNGMPSSSTATGMRHHKPEHGKQCFVRESLTDWQLPRCSVPCSTAQHSTAQHSTAQQP